MNNFNIPKELSQFFLTVASIADKTDLSVYCVGGTARDIILQKEIKDIDLSVDSNIELFSEELSSALMGANRRFNKRFMTSTFSTPEGLRVDLSTLRTEKYSSPAVLPEISISSSINEDLCRRDFTINAIALKLNSNKFDLIDPYEGLNDIKSELIRILHPKSFIDDPLRVLRAIRFKERLSFQLEEETLKLMKKAISNGYHLKLSKSRFWDEMFRFIGEKTISSAIISLDKLKVLNCIDEKYQLSDTVCNSLDNIEKLINDFKLFEAHKAKNMLILIALLQELNTEKIIALMEALNFSKKDMDHFMFIKSVGQSIMSHLKSADSDAQIYAKTADLSQEILIYLWIISNDKDIQKKIMTGIELNSSDILKIEASDLIEGGLKDYKKLSSVLNELSHLFMKESISTREEQLDYIEKIYPLNSAD